MSRAEFAKFTSQVQAPAAAELVSPPPAPAQEAEADLSLRVLLFDADPDTAASIRQMIHASFGDDSTGDWVSDPDEAAELIRESRHDLYLCVDGSEPDTALSLVRASAEASGEAPIILLSDATDADFDRKAFDTGAADCIPLHELSPAALQRSARRALMRQERIGEARREIKELTEEKTRLNMLRDANHRFVENACHDFRSPLTVVKEFASIIAEGLSGDVNEEQSEFLEIILTRVDQLSQMVDGILDASRLESDLIGVKREEYSVATLIEKVRPTLVQRADAHKVAIEFAIPDALPKVFVDAESIGRVVVNLGTNAAKYAGENGTIRVWARYNSEKHEVTIGVSDSGEGIAPEHVKLIFDRFHQVPGEGQQEKGGFGLGLHIASEFVRINFGTLTVESEPNKGSTFAFTVPVFDVDSLIPLHFDFVKTSRHSFQNVAIALATVVGGAGPETRAEVERLLNRQLRSYDLLLPVRPGSWLVCVACDKDEIDTVTDRVLTAYVQASRSRPEMRLPDLRFRPVGAWPVASRPEALRDAIHGVYALGATGQGAA